MYAQAFLEPPGEWQRVSWDTEAFVSLLRESGMNSATKGQQKALKRKPSGSRYCLLGSMQRERESGRKSVRFCLPVCARLKPP